jgi:hypothetical protein
MTRELERAADRDDFQGHAFIVRSPMPGCAGDPEQAASLGNSLLPGIEWPCDGTGECLGFRYCVPTRTLRRGSMVSPSWSTHMRVRS